MKLCIAWDHDADVKGLERQKLVEISIRSLTKKQMTLLYTYRRFCFEIRRYIPIASFCSYSVAMNKKAVFSKFGVHPDFLQ